jgi:hypothetical protein
MPISNSKRHKTGKERCTIEAQTQLAQEEEQSLRFADKKKSKKPRQQIR